MVLRNHFVQSLRLYTQAWTWLRLYKYRLDAKLKPMLNWPMTTSMKLMKKVSRQNSCIIFNGLFIQRNFFRTDLKKVVPGDVAASVAQCCTSTPFLFVAMPRRAADSAPSEKKRPRRSKAQGRTVGGAWLEIVGLLGQATASTPVPDEAQVEYKIKSVACRRSRQQRWPPWSI